MRAEILSHLTQIEARYDVKVVYACESGSRAWGFASANSDYDVRFIYIHPFDWYLSVDEKRDVIESPIHNSLDVNGWDLRKAFRLLKKANPSILEWLHSPIVYIEQPFVVTKLRQLAQDYFSSPVCLYHYLHMAKGNFRDYLQGNSVWLKKYLYVLRPLLVMRWIEQYHCMPPTNFGLVVDRLDLPHDLRQAIDQLLDRKRAGDELRQELRIPILSEFIESELVRWETTRIPRQTIRNNTDHLNQTFIKILYEARGQG